MAGANYYITFIDDYSCYATIRFIRTKSDAIKHLIEHCETVCNETGRYPRAVRSDRGGEYVNQAWADYCLEKGIKHEPTAAYTPASNGVAERFNLTIANMSRAVLQTAPRFLWAEAFNWAVYLRNRLSHSALQGKTPLEVLTKSKPSISHLKPFYSPVLLHIPEDT